MDMEHIRNLWTSYGTILSLVFFVLYMCKYCIMPFYIAAMW